MIRIIIAIVFGFNLGYQYKKYRQMKKDQKLFDECERMLESGTSSEMIERAVNKKLMEKVLRNKIEANKECKQKIYKDLDEFIGQNFDQEI